MAVVIETTLGDLTVDLFIQERPKACLNFLKLCKLKYYNFNLFHNVEHGFIAQTGDPTGAGDGGESVWGVVEGLHKRYFEGESLPKIRHSEPGLVSMVSVGKNMIGSQFFFTLGPDLYSLDGVHCVIGEVAEGHEVLRKLNEAIVDEKFRPYQDIRITHTVILEDPFDDPRGFQIPSRSPSPTPERLKNGRIGADEDIDDTEGKSIQEIQEMLQEREAKARATILEIVGDLPDADIAPPENVLFVCKLNPVTNDDDLEIIFSRFGKVKCCEVIRDKVTGDSLQYAFVEFEDKKSCEQAYFKMDNVLIDDRRIHVDFSQSVAKVRWRGKGRGVVHENSNSNGRLDFNNLRGPKKEKGNFDRRDKNGNPGQSSRKDYPEKRRYDDRRPNNDNREYDRRFNRDDRGRPDRQEDRRQNRDDGNSVERSSHLRPNKDNWKDDRERFGRDDERKSYRDDRDRLEKTDDRRRKRDYSKDDSTKERDNRQRFDRSDRNFDREMRHADRSSNVRGEYDRGRRNEERPGPSQDSRNRDRDRYRDDRDRRDDRRQDEYHHRRREDSRSPVRERVERQKSPERKLKRDPTPERKHFSKEVNKKHQNEDISKKIKKHRKKSEISSDSDSSSSSDSDKRKRKKKKKTKKRRRKKKRSSSSSSSSD